MDLSTEALTVKSQNKSNITPGHDNAVSERPSTIDTSKDQAESGRPQRQCRASSKARSPEKVRYFGPGQDNVNDLDDYDLSSLEDQMPAKRLSSSRKGDDPEYMEREVRKGLRDRKITTKYDAAKEEYKRNA